VDAVSEAIVLGCAMIAAAILIAGFCVCSKLWDIKHEIEFGTNRISVSLSYLAEGVWSVYTGGAGRN
jgi:hypothetical protein